ncbi:MAG TPA: ABC transporter permease, partial [Gemmatimonadales bacterium]|nr:ABC transporter permease [Gemmatimonadales bacterium]
MSWALRRACGAALLAALGILSLVLLVHILPGDPLAAIIGDRALDPASEAALRLRWGVDRTLPESLSDFLAGALRGDLGVSLIEQRPVRDILLERLGPTLLLGGLTLLINFAAGLALGLWSALRPDSLASRITGVVSLACYAVPSFVIALVLVWAFAIAWPVLPAAGIS